jgi:hypothetical protein
LSNPDAIFFDTGIVLSFFNKAEQSIAAAALEHIDRYPHTARHILTPNLVELFYKLRKLISPKDVYSGLDSYGINLFSESSTFEKVVFKDYCKINYTHSFDYADYFLCRTALLLPCAQILTIDKNDFPNAYGTAYNDRNYKGHIDVHLITF